MEYRKDITVDELKKQMERQGPFTPVGIRENVDDSGPFYHGSKADLRIGDCIKAGFPSNYGRRKIANFVYITALMDGAILAAELAEGEGRGRIYIVEPTGAIGDDPNVTDMKFPGNPTRSYRTREPLRIVGEVTDWQGHSPELLQSMKAGVEEARKLGIEAINE
jgi:rifampin ADP-ribosylating transferase